MTLRLDSKNIYLTYNDKEQKIIGETEIIDHFINKLGEEKIQYIVCCKEKAPTTGTQHFHVLVCLKDRIFKRNANELLKIKEILPHIDKIKNNLRAIREYITKGDSFGEFGKAPFRIEKVIDRKEKAKLLLTGNLEELFINGEIGAVDVIRADKLRNIFIKNSKPEKYKKRLIMWFKGPTGEGKTRTAIQIAEQYYEEDYWITNDNLRWFDGYYSQKVAIIDDFRKTMLTDWNFLLRLLDGYNLIVQIKGGFVKWNPKVIIITSPATPEEAFQWVNKNGETEEWDKQDQLTRRLVHNDELQVYDFPLWEDEQKRLENTIRKELGLAPIEEESMFPEEWSTIEPEGFITPG